MIVDNARRPASRPDIITKFRHWSADSLYLISFVNSPGIKTVYWRFSLNFVYSVVFLSWSMALLLRPWPVTKAWCNLWKIFYKEKLTLGRITVLIKEVKTEIRLTVSCVHTRFNLFGTQNWCLHKIMRRKLTWEWIHNVDRSFIDDSKKASKSRKTSLGRSRYLAGWWGIIEAKSRFLQPSRTSETAPIEWGSSGSGETVTSMSFTYFQTLCKLMRARSWSFVPIGTAWSTGTSLLVNAWTALVLWVVFLGKWPLTRPSGGASLYKATSYSKRPGVSSTTPETRAPCGLESKNCILLSFRVS